MTTLEKITNFIGWFCILFISFGTIFKLLHWPGGSVLLLFGCTFACFPFLILLGIIKIKEYPNRFGKFFIGLNVFFAICAIMALVFKMLHWPGAAILLIIGFGLGPILGFLPLLINHARLKSEKHFLQPGILMVGMIFICFYFLSWGIQPARSILQSTQGLTEVFIQQNKETQAEILIYNEDKNDSYIIKANEVLDFIKKCNLEILVSSGENLGDIELFGPVSIVHKDQYDIVMYLMYSTNEKGISRAQELFDKVSDFENSFKSNREESRWIIHEQKNLFNFEFTPVIHAVSQFEAIKSYVLRRKLAYLKEKGQ
jgi:hypothetical protein